MLVLTVLKCKQNEDMVKQQSKGILNDYFIKNNI